MQFQTELGQALPKCLQESLGFRSVFKARDAVLDKLRRPPEHAREQGLSERRACPRLEVGTAEVQRADCPLLSKR
jgi:hypothetical protein